MREQNVTVRLHRVGYDGERAWFTAHVAGASDPRHVQIDIDPVAAVQRDATCFLHPPTSDEARILKSDIVGGVLMARKQLGRTGITLRLLTMGGTVGDQPRVALLSSVAFAVAAHAAVLSVLGDEHQRADLPGGFGWRIDAIGPEQA
jgi:hypothetical protein